MQKNGRFHENFNQNICRAFRWTLILGFVLVTGCEKNPSTIWASNVKSPNGEWIAEAKTQQWGGPGNSYVATTVALRWAPKSGRTPIEILELSNQTAYPVGVTSVRMEWITDTHLDVVYDKEAKVDFQAIKAAGLEITAHPLAIEAAIVK